MNEWDQQHMGVGAKTNKDEKRMNEHKVSIWIYFFFSGDMRGFFSQAITDEFSVDQHVSQTRCLIRRFSEATAINKNEHIFFLANFFPLRGFSH